MTDGHDVHPAILLVENDGDLAEILADVLREEGFRVVPAADLETAVRTLETDTFALILGEYVASKQSEEEARRLLDAAGPVPVGYVTAWPLEESTSLPYSFVLRKPFRLEDLLARVSQFTVPQVSREPLGSLTHAYFAALSARDWSGLAQLCTERVVYHLPGSDILSTRIVGRVALEGHAAMAFSAFPEAKFVVEKLSWLPRGVIAHFSSTWRSTSGGGHVFSGAVLLAFEGDRISEIGVRIDTRRLRLLETSGAM